MVHIKALTLMSTSQRKKTNLRNLRTGEHVSHSTHYSYSTFYTSIWENDGKPFFTFPHRCKTKYKNMFYKAKKSKNMKKKDFLIN